MDKRLIFRYYLLIVISNGRTKFDKSSIHMVGCLSNELVLVGKSARMF